MKQLVILSGKGGTGKTTLTAALAHLASRTYPVVLVDADVDAPNMELILQPRIEYKEAFYGGQLALIDAAACTMCGACERACRFDAIAEAAQSYVVDPLSCEGCAACLYVCPSDAVRMQERIGGQWLRSTTRFGPFFHARLAAGAENSGKMVSLLRGQAQLAAQEVGAELVLIDGSPGIGCPVIAAVTGVDLALVVSEPTLSGAHDLERALAICRHFKVPALVTVNKADINPRQAEAIRAHCGELGVPVLADIPYDDTVTAAMRAGCALTEMSDNATAQAMRSIWAALRERLDLKQDVSNLK